MLPTPGAGSGGCEQLSAKVILRSGGEGKPGAAHLLLSELGAGLAATLQNAPTLGDVESIRVFKCRSRLHWGALGNSRQSERLRDGGFRQRALRFEFGPVKVRNIRICRVYLSQTDNSCQEAKPQRAEIMLRRMAVLPLILYITVKKRRLQEIPW